MVPGTVRTPLLGALQERSDGPKVTFMAQKPALDGTSRPEVDGKRDCVHAEGVITEEVATEIYLHHIIRNGKDIVSSVLMVSIWAQLSLFNGPD